MKGEIWNPSKYKIGTKGDEMRLRLYAAFDLGLRHGISQAADDWGGTAGFTVAFPW